MEPLMKKLALITGSKGGIGSAISSKLVADGYRVIATYFTGNYQCAVDWFKEKQFTEDQVRLFELDVTNTAECALSLSKLLEEEGTVDVLVNNAGITRDRVFKKMDAVRISPRSIRSSIASGWQWLECAYSAFFHC